MYNAEPLISVIIPVYNTEKYVERCIRSIQDNTYSNLEIICVNDGSTDSSLAVLEKLANQDSRIVIIDKPNGGVSSARNAGLDIAAGDYISFIDSDDWVHPLFFSELLSSAIATCADITIAQYKEVYNEKDVNENDTLPEKNIKRLSAREAMSRDGYMRRAVWGRLFKRELIGNTRFPQGIQFGEDTIFNVLIVKSNENRVAFINLPLIYYFQSRGESLVHKSTYISNYILGCWYLDHLESFALKDIAILAALSSLLIYRYEGTFSTKAKEVRRAAKIKLSICIEEMLTSMSFSRVQKLKYLVLTNFPFAYRLALLAADPSYIYHEKALKEKYKHSTVSENRE